MKKQLAYLIDQPFLYLKNPTDMNIKHHTKKFYFTIVFCLILLLAALFRFYGTDWDNGFHLHPDERAIVLYTLPLNFPKTVTQYLSPNSPLNPHFFAYGSFPLYFLKIVSIFASLHNPVYATYDGINILGRDLSVLFELCSMLLIFNISKLVASKKIGLLAMFFYAVSTFPIQNSHFYTVDAQLCFFILLTLYFILKYYEHPSLKFSVLLGLSFGLSLVTKDTGLILLSTIILTYLLSLLLLKSHLNKNHFWKTYISKNAKLIIFSPIFFIVTVLLIIVLFEPYALIDFSSFWLQTQQQSQMTHNAFIFPYTLQYVGIIPYYYELKNIFLWGQGPMLAIICYIGTGYAFVKAIRNLNEKHWRNILVLFLFFIPYFLIVGNFSVAFMRYMLPLYPLLCIFGGLFFYYVFNYMHKTYPRIGYYIIGIFILCSIVIWPLSFMHIYSYPNTRVQASNWIYQNIGQNKTLAVEHWDDQLPLGDSIKYSTLILPLYNPDTGDKWLGVHQILQHTDYIIIASNRLYVPLQKLTDCTKLPTQFCYKRTASYYHDLFSGKLGFKKVAQFSEYPTIPLLGIQINDQSADESFTVYDHPIVMIFKKI